MNLKKNILLLLIMLLITPLTQKKVRAYQVTGINDGGSYTIDLPSCLLYSEGCGGMTEEFVARVTVVDGNNVRVGDDKTTSIVLHPHDPSDEYYGYYTDESYGVEGYLSDSVDGKYDIYGNYNGGRSHDNVWAGDSSIKMDKWSQQDYMFVASNIAWNSYGKNEEKSDLYFGKSPGYEIFMGAFFSANDFSTHSSFREYLIDSIKQQNKLIYIDDIKKKISISDFIMKVTGTNAYLGYPDEWEASTNRELSNKLVGKNYKILIEPVYTMSLKYNGMDHSIRGTSKQIAQVLSRTVDKDHWYWPMYNPTYMYNLACSLTSEGDTSYCESEDNFDIVGKAARRLYDFSQSQKCKNPKTQFDKTMCNIQLKAATNVFEGTAVQELRNKYEEIANSDSAYGVNILYLDDIYFEQQKEEHTNQCEYIVSSCENNNFEISARLNSSTGDIFDCIYPSDTNKIDRKELSQYSVQFENGDLWCYDDVSYSFASLREDAFKNLNKNPIITNQLLAIPNGTLTVERTCFSKKNSIPTGDLDQALGKDFGSIYQNEIQLELNGKKYTYKRDEKRYDENRSNFGQEKISPYNEKYYEYKSSFKYDYKLTEGEDATKTNINVINYNISNSLGSSNGIDYSKDINAKIIISQKMDNKEYTNFLYNNSKQKLRITDGFGYGNKMYKALDMYSEVQKEDDNTLNRVGKRESWHDEDLYSFTNTYTLTENINKNCTFKTTGTNRNIWDEIRVRTISLSNPFPARDGTSRMPGSNWITDTHNYVYDYIQNNRNVKNEKVYEKAPLYKITLDTSSMIKIREYNKKHSYSDYSVTCESGTGRKCINAFLKNEKYIKNLEGTCTQKEQEKNKTDFYSCADKLEYSGG